MYALVLVVVVGGGVAAMFFDAVVGSTVGLDAVAFRTSMVWVSHS